MHAVTSYIHPNLVFNLESGSFDPHWTRSKKLEGSGDMESAGRGWKRGIKREI